MAKVDRGTKRLCEACGGKFYDLGRSPIVCPMCETELVLEEPKAKAEPKPEPEPEKEPDKKPEKKPDADAPKPETAEFISLDEAAAEEEGDDEAALADIDGDDEDIPAADEEEDVFLEDDEDESGSDVSGIIGGPIDTKEES